MKGPATQGSPVLSEELRVEASSYTSFSRLALLGAKQGGDSQFVDRIVAGVDEFIPGRFDAANGLQGESLPASLWPRHVQISASLRLSGDERKWRASVKSMRSMPFGEGFNARVTRRVMS